MSRSCVRRREATTMKNMMCGRGGTIMNCGRGREVRYVLRRELAGRSFPTVLFIWMCVYQVS